MRRRAERWGAGAPGTAEGWKNSPQVRRGAAASAGGQSGSARSWWGRFAGGARGPQGFSGLPKFGCGEKRRRGRRRRREEKEKEKGGGGGRRQARRGDGSAGGAAPLRSRRGAMRGAARRATRRAPARSPVPRHARPRLALPAPAPPERPRGNFVRPAPLPLLAPRPRGARAHRAPRARPSPLQNGGGGGPLNAAPRFSAPPPGPAVPRRASRPAAVGGRSGAAVPEAASRSAAAGPARPRRVRARRCAPLRSAPRGSGLCPTKPLPGRAGSWGCAAGRGAGRGARPGGAARVPELGTAAPP